MRKSTLIINGATRASGNTDILVERVVAGATDVNLYFSLVELRDKLSFSLSTDEGGGHAGLPD